MGSTALASLAGEVSWFGAGLLLNGVVTWAVVRLELRYLRRDVDHAHKRLDGFVSAPSRR